MTDAVAAYLADLTLPATGTVCSDEAPPAPVTTAKAAGTTQYSELRDGVQEGQDLIRPAR